MGTITIVCGKCGSQHSAMVNCPECTKRERQAKIDGMILDAAKREMKWDSADTRHDHAAWKAELRQRLWDELKMDYEIYT